jgi:hypothetical protein
MLKVSRYWWTNDGCLVVTGLLLVGFGDPALVDRVPRTSGLYCVLCVVCYVLCLQSHGNEANRHGLKNRGSILASLDGVRLMLARAFLGQGF